ncbi:MAG: TetR/AcrR family transcriptional regulator [Cellulomonas sp.]
MDKRDRTRAALREAALGLFAEHGYDRTTTAQVASRAGVSEMTLFRHFASKEALLLEDPFDPVMAASVSTRPASEGPLRAVAEGIREAWTTMAASDVADLRWLLGVVSGTPSLQGALERSSSQTAAALTVALESRGVATGVARVAAAAAIAGLSRALLDWSLDEERDLDACVHRALDVLGGR